MTRTNGQAVRLHFATWPKVDVCRPRKSSTRGQGVEYCIPDANRGAWVHTRPRHDLEMALAASARGPQFKQAVKVLKG